MHLAWIQAAEMHMCFVSLPASRYVKGIEAVQNVLSTESLVQVTLDLFRLLLDGFNVHPLGYGVQNAQGGGARVLCTGGIIWLQTRNGVCKGYVGYVGALR
jgi:hypothetical protein